eukprot:SAG31_NODE_995_length_10494_cov_8.173641_2_plen_60_part_00
MELQKALRTCVAPAALISAAVTGYYTNIGNSRQDTGTAHEVPAPPALQSTKFTNTAVQY